MRHVQALKSHLTQRPSTNQLDSTLTQTVCHISWIFVPKLHQKLAHLEVFTHHFAFFWLWIKADLLPPLPTKEPAETFQSLASSLQRRFLTLWWQIISGVCLHQWWEKRGGGGGRGEGGHDWRRGGGAGGFWYSCHCRSKKVYQLSASSPSSSSSSSSQKSADV